MSPSIRPPPPKPTLRDRGVALLELVREDAGKTRPAIVVRMFPKEGRALVICGTGTRRTGLAVIEVEQSSYAGKALQLTKTTYFYGDAVKSVLLTHLEPVHGSCPPELFLQIRFLVEGALSVMTEGQLTKDLPADAVPGKPSKP